MISNEYAVFFIFLFASMPDEILLIADNFLAIIRKYIIDRVISISKSFA